MKSFLAVIGVLIASNLACKERSEQERQNSLKNLDQGALISYHGEQFEYRGGEFVAVAVPKNSDEALSEAKEQSFSLNGPTNNYMDECTKNSVPLPPVWPEGWTKQIEIAKEKILSGPIRDTDLWTYSEKKGSEEKGVCVGIHRKKIANTPGEIFAVICTSKETGATCFWDSREPVRGISTFRSSRYNIALTGTGLDHSKEICTDCHRGPTPWIRVSGTPMAQLPAISKKPWYAVVKKDETWMVPKGKDIPGCSAGACHSMPVLNRDFCAIAGSMYKRNLMPPPAIVKDPNKRAEMAAAMSKACEGL